MWNIKSFLIIFSGQLAIILVSGPNIHVECGCSL